MYCHTIKWPLTNILLFLFSAFYPSFGYRNIFFSISLNKIFYKSQKTEINQFASKSVRVCDCCCIKQRLGASRRPATERQKDTAKHAVALMGDRLYLLPHLESELSPTPNKPQSTNLKQRSAGGQIPHGEVSQVFWMNIHRHMIYWANWDVVFKYSPGV